MKKYLALLGLMTFSSVYAQELKNVVSVSVPALTISSAGGTTVFAINGNPTVEYDRSLTRLISVFGHGSLVLTSVRNRTATTFILGGGVRFWFFRPFSGLYVGPFLRLVATSPGTSFVIGGDVGYRMYLARKFALSFGGGPAVSFGRGSSVISLLSYVSVGYPF